MMHSWKYSLPAFLVPFLFSSSAVGANLLIIGASLDGFILASVNGAASLFFLSTGVVGFMGITLSWIERSLLIAAAVIMAFVPLGLSIPGIVPAVVGIIVMMRVLFRARRRRIRDSSVV